MVISDDASVDATRAIIIDFARLAPFPVRLHTNSVRLGSTRNFEMAIRACESDIIFLCDQDDVWYEDKIALMEKCFVDNESVGMVFSDADVVDQDLRQFVLRLWKAVRFNPREQAQVATFNAFPVLRKRFIVTGATMAFRSVYRDLVLPISDKWGHDGWIALLISATSDIQALANPLIAYRQHSANQIGVPPRGKNRGKTCAAVHGPQVLRYEAALARLQEFADRFPDSRHNVLKLDEILTFLRLRAALPDARLPRLATAWRQFITLQYHRHAQGFKSFRKDILR